MQSNDWGIAFKRWQNKFYNSKQWTRLAKEVRMEAKNRCNMCNRFIKPREATAFQAGMSGRHIVDHVLEITPDNRHDADITLNKDNLQLLCLECHTIKTAQDKRERKIKPIDLETKRKINLF